MKNAKKKRFFFVCFGVKFDETRLNRLYLNPIYHRIMDTFDDIPFEVFLIYIIPLLDLAEVGALTATCTTFRDMCEDNEVWKVLYMRTIRAQILDTSVHIGSSYDRYRDIRGERIKGISPLFYKNHPITGVILDNPGVTVSLINRTGTRGTAPWYASWGVRDSNELLHCHCCLRSPANADFVATLKSWRDVRTDGIDNNDFINIQITQHHHWHQSASDVGPYLSYVEDAWIKYNREHGLSTVNLCQCPDHYQFDTLGLPNGCRNYKSFKKMTLKKERTRVEKLSKKSSNKYDSRRRDYEAAMRVMKRAESKMIEARDEDKIISRLCENLDNVPGVKKVKKPSIGIAHPKPSGVGWWDARCTKSVSHISTHTSTD